MLEKQGVIKTQFDVCYAFTKNIICVINAYKSKRKKKDIIQIFKNLDNSRALTIYKHKQCSIVIINKRQIKVIMKYFSHNILNVYASLSPHLSPSLPFSLPPFLCIHIHELQ